MQSAWVPVTCVSRPNWGRWVRGDPNERSMETCLLLSRQASASITFEGWMGGKASKQPLQAVPNVDIERYMGAWCIVGVIPPTSQEKKACDPVETYRLEEDGRTVAIEYTFVDGSPTGPRRKYHPKGIITDPMNKSTWKILVVWPIYTEYIISYLDADYQYAIIARNKRDYAWIMSRTPLISEETYATLAQRLKDMGYSTENLVRPLHQDPASQAKTSV